MHAAIPNPATPRGILHRTYAALSTLTRDVPLTQLTAWQGSDDAKARRQALDKAILSDDLPATKATAWAYLKSWGQWAGVSEAVLRDAVQRTDATEETL